MTALPLPLPSVSADALLPRAGRYVVGFDGSSASRTALTWVAARAARGGATVELVGVTDGEAGAVGEEYAHRSALSLARLLSQAADDVGATHPGLAVATRLVEGEVASALAPEASADDVLVVGSDKTGYLQGRVYGLRAVQLAALAATTLVVVPAADLRLREGVVVAVADTEALPRLVATGAREARQRRSPLLLLLAIPAGSAEEAKAEGGRLLARARSMAVAECDGLEVASHLSQRRPAEAVLDASRERAILLVGRSRRSGPLGVGGTLQELLLNANAPTAVIG